LASPDLVALAELWRTRAEGLERTAQTYKRSCVKDKMMQNILLARQLRGLADELEKAIAE
jgi:hypothetical protein